MSAGYWPRQVAKVLNHAVGFKHELVNIRDSEIDEYLQKAIQSVPLEQFIGLVEDYSQHVVKEDRAQYTLFEDELDNSL
jgi:hypothetical protein